MAFELSSILNRLNTKVGGELSSETAKNTSFEAIRYSLDSMPIEYLEDYSNPGVLEIFKVLSNRKNIEFVEKYSSEEKDAAEKFFDEIKKSDFSKNSIAYVTKINRLMELSSRLIKLYHIFNSSNPKVNEEANSNKEAISRIVNNSFTGGVETIQKLTAHNTDEADRLEKKDISKLDEFKEVLKSFGLEASVRTRKVKKKENSSEKELPYRESNRNKKRLINRLMRTMSLAQLPAITDGRVTTNGDYFKLFKALERENLPWMENSLSKYVFKGDSARFSQFNADARNNETALEEDQVIYLNASRSWIHTYIESQVTGTLNAKEVDNYLTSLRNTSQEKEREIKNYYVSRDFNLANFGGIQLKPEIKIPLYGKVNLAVSEEDRKKESPLRNVLRGLGAAVTALFSQMPIAAASDLGRAAKQRNLAVLKAVNSIFRAGTAVIGGKQAARDYDELVSKLPGNRKKEGLREDMLAMTDAPGYVAVNPEAPGQVMQTPDSLATGMDTFALAGPGRKKSKKGKKKEKPIIPSNRVMTFSDFLNLGKAK